jgi:hypothetical protein
LFADLDSLDKSGIHKEDEKGNENESRFITDSIPYPVDKPASTSGGTKPNEERNLQVYTRRRSRTKKMSQLEEQQATHEITEVEVRSSDSPNLVQVSSNTNEEGLEIGEKKIIKPSHLGEKGGVEQEYPHQDTDLKKVI